MSKHRKVLFSISDNKPNWDCGDTNAPRDNPISPGTILISPNYTDTYLGNECRAVIKFEEGERILLQFLYFNVKFDSCVYDRYAIHCKPCGSNTAGEGDFLEIKDGDRSLISRELAWRKYKQYRSCKENAVYPHQYCKENTQLCGAKAPVPIVSTSNALYIYFRATSQESTFKIRLDTFVGKILYEIYFMSFYLILKLTKNNWFHVP